MKKITLITIGVILLIGRYVWYEENHVSRIPEAWFDEKTEIVGTVTQDPDRGLDRTKVVFGELGILVTLPSSVPVSYGDTISVVGIVERPESFMTETNREFNYPRYLSVQEIYGVMRAHDIKVVSVGNGNPIYEILFAIKKTFVTAIKNLFDQAEAGLFAGIMMGEKSLLPKDVLADFQVAGLTHIIVLSGHNITLVIMAVSMMLSWLGLGYRAKRVGAIMFIPLFLVMTGLGASSVRAGVMAIIMLMLQIMTRPAHTLRIILLTIVVIGWVNPRVILFDPSFHLSLLAFVGLIYIVPIAKEWSVRMPNLLGMGPLIVETTAVQLFVLPYILWMSGQISFLILASNLLVVPIGPFIMSGGFVATILGMVHYSLGSMIAQPIELMLSYSVWVAKKIGAVDGAVIIIPPFGMPIMIGCYITIIVWLTWRARTGSDQTSSVEAPSERKQGARP